jgi:hypothetical protein
MKARLALGVIVVLMLVPAISSGGVVFGVKPNLGVQSSYFGLNMGQITPYIGVDLIGIGAEGKYSSASWQEDWVSGGLYKWRENELDLSGSATLIIPHIGLKFFLSHNELRPYFYGSFFKAFASVNVEGTSSYREYDPQGQLIYEDEDDMEMAEEEKEIIQDILSPWGLAFGFGAEYPFSDHFSIGAEFGVRLIFTSTKFDDVESGDWDNDGMDDYRNEWEQELSGSLKLSQAAIALIYYF